MPTDIKNQQENKSTHEKNNISRDIIIELQQAEKKQNEKNLGLANFIHQDSVRTMPLQLLENSTLKR